MKLHIIVEPNGHNKHGYNLVIYRTYFGFFHVEIGRVPDEEGLRGFIDAYKRLNGQVI